MSTPNSQLPTPKGSAFEGADQPSRALIDKCVHCGFCLPTCPTYVLWGEEMDSPRGRIYLMKAGLEGRAEMTQSFVQHFDRKLEMPLLLLWGARGHPPERAAESLDHRVVDTRSFR